MEDLPNQQLEKIRGIGGMIVQQKGYAAKKTVVVANLRYPAKRRGVSLEM